MNNIVKIVKPKEGHYFFLVIFLFLFVCVILLLVGVAFYTFIFKRTIVSRGNTSDTIVFYFMIYVTLPMVVWLMYDRIGRWLIIDQTRVSYPKVFKFTNTKYLRKEDIESFSREFSLQNNTKVRSITIKTKSGKKVRYANEKFRDDIIVMLMEMLRGWGIKEESPEKKSKGYR